MKDRIIYLVGITTLLIVFLSGCANTSAAEDDTKVLRMGHIQNESHPWHKGSEKFAELGDEKTDGSVKIDIYPSSTLGSDRDLVEGMQIGRVDFAVVAGVMSNFYEPYALLKLPYRLEDMKDLEDFLYGPERHNLQGETLEGTGVHGLEFRARGPRQLTSNKPVENIDDLKGMRIRVPSIEASIEGWQALGANPTPIS